jgi:hypothetical protein
MSEDRDIALEATKITTITGHENWPVVRAKLTDRILDLQNAFNILDTDPTAMIVDLKARKLATALMFDWLRDIEGTVAQKEEVEKDSYIVRK